MVTNLLLTLRAKRKSGNVGDRLEQESLEFHNKVREGFIQIAKNNPDRVKIIDGKKSIEEIQKEILEKIIVKMEG